MKYSSTVGMGWKLKNLDGDINSTTGGRNNIEMGLIGLTIAL